MDYRYEINKGSRELHRKRKAFIILKGKLDFLPDNSDMSHFEYCQSIGIDKEEFNKITRGYFMDGRVVFYKDNFIYDDDLIEEALLFINEIAKALSKNEMDIYFGHIPEKNFALDYYYGKYENGNIIKINSKEIE